MPAQLMTYHCPHCGKPIDVDAGLGERVLTCPNPECQKPFQLEVPKAKPTPTLIVPPETQPGTDGEAAPPPVAQITPLAEPELVRVHPEMFRRFPVRFGLMVLGLLVALFGLMYFLLTGWNLLALVCLVAGGYFGYRLVAWWLRDRSTTLTITTRRSILRSGIFNGVSVEIPHAEVRDVHVTQNLRDRLFNLGDLLILGPEQDGKSIQVLGVPNAEAIAAQIRSRRQP
jgi:uncharacterized membrane protein YdbT with pleckstrin-like domain